MVSDHIDLGFAMVLFVFGGKSWESQRDRERWLRRTCWDMWNIFLINSKRSFSSSKTDRILVVFFPRYRLQLRPTFHLYFLQVLGGGVKWPAAIQCISIPQFTYIFCVLLTKRPYLELKTDGRRWRWAGNVILLSSLILLQINTIYNHRKFLIDFGVKFDQLPIL